MTIDYKALAERIQEAIDAQPLTVPEVAMIDKADLRTIVSLLEGMAKAKPPFYVHRRGQDDEDFVHAEAVNGPCPDCEALYLHPTPQPQPEPIDPHMIVAEDRFTDDVLALLQPQSQRKCGCRACLTPAELLCTFVVCPGCGDKRCPKADDHRNACSNSNAPGQVPQPEPAPEGAPYGIIDPDYGRAYTIARKIAWEDGYAIGLHGSFTRDLDMIAVPWADTACEPEHLIRRIADAAGLRIREGVGVKPHGRLAWTLKFPTFGDPRFIDLSVMPRVLADEQPQPEPIEAQIPDVLFDGYSVMQALSKQAQARTSAENVSDVLDAVVRVLRAALAAKEN